MRLAAGTMPSGCQEMSSEQLAQQCQAGCSDSFEPLVGLHADRIFNFVCQMVGNRADAEDLTQETFVKAYHSLSRYNPAYSFTTWLFTIARRTVADFFRKRITHEPLPEEIGTDDRHPGMALEQNDLRTSLWDLAKNLKKNQYEALWLRYGEGFSVSEIAQIMRTNSIYVKVLLHRARLSLAKSLTRAGITID
jgi:RNA polymerase sigma-70 factor, ECF subfamily